MSKRENLLAIDYVKGATSGGTSRVVSGGGGTVDTTNFLLRDGTRSMLANFDMGGFSITNVNLVDGIDVAAHAANPNAHHARQHSYDSTSDHTGTLSWSNVNKAGSNLTDIVTRTHNSLQSIGENDHHNRQHSITSTSDHTVTGSNFDLVGLNATNTLGILTPSANVSSGIERILKSSSTGNLNLASLTTTLINSGSGATLEIAPGNYLVLNPAGYLIQLTSGRAIQSDNYSSQTTGMRIDHAGGGDFRYLYTDEMHAKTFIADLEQALAGGQIISKSVAILNQNFTAPPDTGTIGERTTTLVVEDLPGTTAMAVFQNGDIVRLRNFSRASGSLSITDCWGSVTLDTTYGTSGFLNGTQRYSFVRSTSPNGGAMTSGTTVEANTLVLDYGTTGNGYYEVNAIDGAYAINSPYAQVVTWTSHPATGKTTRARLGNLVGIFGGTNEYGLYAGDGGTATSSQYLRISNSGVGLFNVPLRMYTGATETVHIGGWNDVWLGPNSSDKRMSFDGSTLTINAVVSIQAGSAGYGNLSGIPTSLANINSTEGAKLGTIATGATKNTVYRQSTQPAISNGDLWYNTSTNVWYQCVSGVWQVAGNYITNTTQLTDGAGLGQTANWNNLSSLPARFSFETTPTGQAKQLFLAANAMGYWDGTNWRTYFDNTGQMVLRGSDGAYVCWNGSTLFGGTSTSSATAKWYVDSTNGYLVAGTGTVALMNYGFLMNNSDLSGGGSWPFVSGGLHSVSNVTSPSTGYRGSLLFGVPTGVWALQPTSWHFHYPGNLPQAIPSPTGGSSWDTAIAISDDTETNFVWHSGNDGSGSGLDADTLDTYHASAFARLAGSPTFTTAVLISRQLTGFYHQYDGVDLRTYIPSNLIGYVGTVSNHPLGLMTNGIAFVTLTTTGRMMVGNSSDLYSARIQTDGNIHAEGVITSESYLQLSTEAAPSESAGWGRIWFDGTNLRLTTAAGTYTINKS